MKVPIVALAFLFLLFSSFGLSALQIMGTNGVNSASCTIGLINSTSFIYRNVTASAVGAYYYMPVGGTPTLLNADLAWGSFDSNGMPVVMETAQNRVWFIETSQTSSAWLVKYFDLASKTTSANVFSLGWGGASPNGLGIALNNSQMVFGGAVVSSVKSWLWSGFTNGTLVFANSSAVGNGKYSNPAMSILAFDGKYYLGTPNAIIHLISASSLTSANATVETNETLSAISTGTESAPFLFTIGNASFPYMLFSSNEAGNQELYWAITNQTASKTRLTSTGSVNETLESAWQSPFGTVYVVYSNNTASGGTTCVNKNLTMTLDYFCPATNSALGVVCAGETGYGGVPAGGNAELPTNITQDSLYLQVYDNARCTFYSSDTCKLYNLLIPPNEDWVYANFYVNGAPAPNGSTCYLSDNVSVLSMVLNNPSNPFGISSSTSNFSVNGNQMVGKTATTTCYNGANMSQSLAISFYVQDTTPALIASKWSDSAGSTKDQYYDDIVDLHDAVSIKTNIAEQSDDYGGWCWNTLGSKTNDASAFNGIKNSGQGLPSGENNFQFIYNYKTDETGYAFFPEGYAYYTTRCGAWVNPSHPRESSEAESRRFYVFDKCGGSTDGTAEIDGHYFVQGNTARDNNNNTFVLKQIPVFSPSYTISYNFSTPLTCPNPQCAYSITNSNSSIVKTGTLYRNIVNGQQCIKYEDTHSVLVALSTASFSGFDNKYLPADTYNYSITCSNKEPSVCVADTTFDGSFTIINGAGCANTPASCGESVCAVCNTSSFLCENNQTIDLPASCVNQYCNPAVSGELFNVIDPALANFIAGSQCSIYSVEVSTNKPFTTIPCNEKNSMVFSATVSKSGQQFDMAGSGTCTMSLFQIFQPYSFRILEAGRGINMKWDAVSQSFTVSIDEINKYYGNSPFVCGSSYHLSVGCSSPSLFSIKHTGSLDFELAGLNFCKDGTVAGTCVADRTGDDGDRPLYCDTNLNLLNNSQTCGCPNGMQYNAGTNSCSGNRSTNYVSKDDIKGWLIGLFNNWWLVLIIMIGVILIFKKQRIEQS